MTDISRFKPKTVYVIYIAAAPQAVFDALTNPTNVTVDVTSA